VFALRHDVTFQVLTKRPERLRDLMLYYRPVSGPAPFSHRVLAAASLRANRDIPELPWPLPNVWIGTSAENQHWLDIRLPILQQIPAAKIFLSLEPLLQYIDARKALHLSWVYSSPGGGHIPIPPTEGGWWADNGTIPGDTRKVDWVIVGGESGAEARPVPVTAITSIVEQCRTAGVPAFVKQDCASKPGLQGDIPDDIWAVKQFPAEAA
jgi:protein gp37